MKFVNGFVYTFEEKLRWMDNDKCMYDVIY